MTVQKKAIYDAKKHPMKVVTGTVRASYVNVFRPRIAMGDEDKAPEHQRKEYSLMIIIDKEDRSTLDALDSAIKAAVAKQWGNKTPRGLKLTLHDAEEKFAPEDPDNEAEQAEFDEVYRGKMVLGLKTSDKPDVIRGDMSTITDATDFKSGDFCRVSIRAYTYDRKDDKTGVKVRGVSFRLDNIQKLGTGKALGPVKAKATDDFDAVEMDEEDGQDVPL